MPKDFNGNRPVSPKRCSLLFNPSDVADEEEADESFGASASVNGRLGATASIMEEGSASLSGSSMDSLKGQNKAAKKSSSPVYQTANNMNSPSTSLLLSSNPSGHSTTGHLPLTSAAAAASSNLSQPNLIIPATRFDTVTSYVDVIYQHQQQQQQQGSQAQSADLRDSGSEVRGVASSSSSKAFSRPQPIPSSVVILSPAEGIDGDSSFMATCPNCTMMVMTELEPVYGQKTYRMTCLLSVCMACWVPFYWKSFSRKWADVKHYCPKCHQLIAIYRK